MKTKKLVATCNVVTASLPELLQSRNKNSSSGQIWNKLPDMPFSSFSMHRLLSITFSGGHKVEKRNTDKPSAVYKPVPLIHI